MHKNGDFLTAHLSVTDCFGATLKCSIRVTHLRLATPASVLERWTRGT